MINYKEVQKTEQEMVSIKCDLCRRVYAASDLNEIQEFHHIAFFGGYGSVFGDGLLINCDICQHCLHYLIGKFCRYNDEPRSLG